ncbi:MAG: glutamine synthetase type III [Ruminococcaceae bacterium]|nr:glutamine synthetase type III [Oscillospiraceae bacterium]
MNITEIFGCEVFNEAVMKEKLPKETYKLLKKTIHDGKPLDLGVANTVANAMKDWAIEKGATHYTHWFQPMTGFTAEKHDSFITPTEDGHIIMEFSGKELIKGESDASSFPSGGLRDTCEARGYTAWDPTSCAFVKDGTLCIPTAFCSYTGDALDKKTPLLRSMSALEIQALRILRLFGNTTAKRVITTVGPEQEYFLIDKKYYDERKDLIYCGRTLFGAPAPKGQEMEDHYFGALKPRISAFMQELDRELWKLGVLAKTKHNEAAPAQHELAPIFSTTNVAVDHNQITMETLKKVANRHGLVCLLHEKPFEGINGSGKHNNWSMSTDTGLNLLDPGKTPSENAQFLLFLAAVIKAVDEYQGMMRVSVASAGNDHRLGGGEAPPAIVSIFLGDELEAIFDAIENDTAYEDLKSSKMKLGVDILPAIPRDNTDRNRTSPFAFTGNKFEFRMLGSAASVADPNIVLNTITAEILMQFADELEEAHDFTTAVNDIVKRTIKNHKRIIFNGNGYSDEWREEAKKKGLLNLESTVDALPVMIEPKNIEVFVRHKVFSETEIRSRYEIQLENYAKIINIEALTAIDMVRKEYIPAIIKYSTTVALAVNSKSVHDIPCRTEIDIMKKLSMLTDIMYDKVAEIESLDRKASELAGKERADLFRKSVIPAMAELRRAVDEAEKITSKKFWPVPSYGDLIFKI